MFSQNRLIKAIAESHLKDSAIALESYSPRVLLEVGRLLGVVSKEITLSLGLAAQQFHQANAAKIQGQDGTTEQALRQGISGGCEYST